MSKRKVLYICHNHPSVRPGGSEAYALELYEAMRASDEFEPVLLTKAGPPMSEARLLREETLLSTVNDDPHQYFFYTDGSNYDWFYGTLRDKRVYTKHFNEFLLAYQPDIVHFQHTLFLGYDLIRQTRNTLPNARIVYTLHEYLPICHNHGQMIRTHNHELCTAASPRRCHECFPAISPQAFFSRRRFIQSHFSLVDLFLSPSRFLVERYAQWGVPREKLRYEPNGRRMVSPVENPVEERPRNRFGYFGQFSVYKGVNILLKAVQELARGAADAEPVSFSTLWRAPDAEVARASELQRPDQAVHVWLYGANLELQPGAFQNEFRALLEQVGASVTLGGQYQQADLPRLMADVDWVVLPSIWWENAPLVIQEAFQHGRPVICSDIGGMAEQVTHGVNGLHFRVGDPTSLAQTLRYAASTPGLWEMLRSGIPEVYRMEDHVASLSEIYQTLLNRHQAGKVHASN